MPGRKKKCRCCLDRTWRALVAEAANSTARYWPKTGDRETVKKVATAASLWLWGPQTNRSPKTRLWTYFPFLSSLLRLFWPLPAAARWHNQVTEGGLPSIGCIFYIYLFIHAFAVRFSESFFISRSVSAGKWFTCVLTSQLWLKWVWMPSAGPEWVCHQTGQFVFDKA